MADNYIHVDIILRLMFFFLLTDTQLSNIVVMFIDSSDKYDIQIKHNNII